MIILGISCYFHDAAAALIEDGLLVAAAEEERFSRIKHDSSFPENAIQFCLDKAGIEGPDVDYVVFYEKPFLKFERMIKSAAADFPRSYWPFVQGMRTWLFDKLWVAGHISKFLGVPRKRILFNEHHMSHAASAFYCSPFETAAVLTVDGVGEWSTATLGVGSGNSLTISDEQRFPHSVGLLYSTFTAFLGFEVNEGEYKVMGMAPYGEPRYVEDIWKIVKLHPDGSTWLDLRYFAFHRSTRSSFSRKFVGLFGAPRDPDIPFFTSDEDYRSYFGDRLVSGGDLIRYNRHYADIAASIQVVTEEILLALANHLHRTTGLSKLCFAGGVALNSVANGRLLNETPFNEIYVQPAAGDAGGALGAALYVWKSALGKDGRFQMNHVYWGEEYGPDITRQSLDEAGMTWEHVEDRSRRLDMTLDRILDGKVIGLAQGRFEWGPRALGNRSIIADPRREDMKDIVNTKIKFREPFRPFAPSILAEKVPEFFDIASPTAESLTQFMLLVTGVKGSRADEIPAVSHRQTARIQSVRSDVNPDFYELISRFDAVTGVPMLLNTSFNVRGEPIVSSPHDAIRTFVNSGIDTLIVGDYMVDKP